MPLPSLSMVTSQHGFDVLIHRESYLCGESHVVIFYFFFFFQNPSADKELPFPSLPFPPSHPISLTDQRCGTAPPGHRWPDHRRTARVVGSVHLGNPVLSFHFLYHSTTPQCSLPCPPTPVQSYTGVELTCLKSRLLHVCVCVRVCVSCARAHTHTLSCAHTHNNCVFIKPFFVFVFVF